ncbi:MAG TPA: LuxR family transcriptional regulator [Mycobacterium sp.]|nr:LuxR family transcriptional regulator [Mycobacterium sp.]
MSELPTGTVTLLLADVEGSTGLWQAQPEQMTNAIAQLDRTLSTMVTAHAGVRPVEQGEGDSFVVAFARASDAVGCALDLQRAPLEPLRLRIGIHTGEVQLRDEGNYIGPTINRTARLRDLAHGGQTLLSGVTEALVTDRLPEGAWLTDLGTHPLRDLPRPERVVQLRHPDLRNEFPPLRMTKSLTAHNLPAQLTSFVGRAQQIEDVRQLLGDNRLVTLTGAGGAGKTRMAVQVAAQLVAVFGDGVWYVDLAPITDAGHVEVAVARALGLPDQPSRSTMDTLIRFIDQRRILVVLDNCEHLLQACATLVVALLGASSSLTVLATSREPIGVAGEVSWRVPSLSLSDEAIELFTDRARRALPEFRLAGDNTTTVAEICRRLDGMPLAIELAASRVRALSLEDILAGLHDRFRLLTGGTRTAVRRQQTLRASVDWSYALLTEPERVVFRRLAVFMGSFDLDAAQAVAGGGDLAAYQVLDELTLLVDKSLVVAEKTSGKTRFRLLETMRQYALEKLGESGEADAVRTRHRDHYIAMAARLENPTRLALEQLIDEANAEIGNLGAAFAWSRQTADVDLALQLASALQPLWLRGRVREGSVWLDAALSAADAKVAGVSPAMRARALADKAWLDNMRNIADNLARAQRALAIARELDDPPLLVRALTACGRVAVHDADLAERYLAEASELARVSGDEWRLSSILYSRALAAILGHGDPIAARAAAEEGRKLADAVGDRLYSRGCRWCLGGAQVAFGDLDAAIAQFRGLVAEAETAHDSIWTANGLTSLSLALAYHGEAAAARATALAAAAPAADIGEFQEGAAYTAVAVAALAGGDVEQAADASEAAQKRLTGRPAMAATNANPMAQVALAHGDLRAARGLIDDAVTAAAGWQLSLALTTRARIAAAQGEPGQAERDARDALARAATPRAYLAVPDILECLADLRCTTDSTAEAARLFAAAHSIRTRLGIARFQIYDAGHEAALAVLRNAMGRTAFEASWAEGAALSIEEAIAYAQRGRGQRSRSTSGWESLTPTELDVVRLAGEGLGNKDIGKRLFISPRTVQTHLTHVYNKLGLSSRVQLVHEAARHT